MCSSDLLEVFGVRFVVTDFAIPGEVLGFAAAAAGQQDARNGKRQAGA